MEHLKRHAALIEKAGYGISYFGLVLIFIWLGAFKFTPTEANAIKPLIENHPLVFFLYDFLNQQQVSDLFGIVEIATGVLLLAGIRIRKLQFYGALIAIFTFIITLSFLFTTPGRLRYADGFPVIDFFILKDLLLLGFSVLILGHNLKRK